MLWIASDPAMAVGLVEPCTDCSLFSAWRISNVRAKVAPTEGITPRSAVILRWLDALMGVRVTHQAKVAIAGICTLSSNALTIYADFSPDEFTVCCGVASKPALAIHAYFSHVAMIIMAAGIRSDALSGEDITDTSLGAVAVGEASRLDLAGAGSIAILSLSAGLVRCTDAPEIQRVAPLKHLAIRVTFAFALKSCTRGAARQ